MRGRKVSFGSERVSETDTLTREGQWTEQWCRDQAGAEGAMAEATDLEPSTRGPLAGSGCVQDQPVHLCC